MNERRWMPVVTGAALVACTYGGIAIAGDMTMIELRQNGWAVVDKSERVESRDSLDGYSQGQREVLITEYTLEKASAVMKCVITYDNHLDKVTQTCRSGG